MQWQILPLDLKCPCGLPLSLGMLDDGRYVLGDLVEPCSPLIVHRSLYRVFMELGNMVKNGTFSASPPATPPKEPT